MNNVNQGDAIWDFVQKIKTQHKLVLVIQMHIAANVTEKNAKLTSNVNMDNATKELAMTLFSGFLYSQAH